MIKGDRNISLFIFIEMSNFTKLMERFKKNFPDDLKNKVDIIENIVTDYIQKNKITVKFLNSCSTGFQGVRTRDAVIICSPINMNTIGDFLYTIFHELRHEKQIKEIKMMNPLTEYDLEDFESLYEQYWEMELDADQFAKNMIAKIVIQLKIPMDFAKKQFSLSEYIENYPKKSAMIKSMIKNIVVGIKKMRQSGIEYTDISDHPIVKSHLEKLEDFI
jgi:hypothetical protein